MMAEAYVYYFPVKVCTGLLLSARTRPARAGTGQALTVAIPEKLS